MRSQVQRDRGKLIMYFARARPSRAWKIAEELAGAGKRVLFRSLALLQSLTEWTQESGTPLH